MNSAVTDEQRKQFLLLANRLANWHARSRLDAAEFIHRNRADFDALAKPVAQPFAAKPPRRRKPRRWYNWDELSERQLLAIKKTIRKRGEFLYAASLKFKFRLISVKGPNDINELERLWGQSRARSGIGRMYYQSRLPDSSKKNHYVDIDKVFNKKGTIADRLLDAMNSGVRYQYNKINRHREPPQFTIQNTLHPDDTWVGVNNEFAIARDCCLNAQFPVLLLAKSLLLTDETGCCVYYIAVLEMGKRGKKKGVTEVNRYYIGTTPIYASKQDPLAHLRRFKPSQKFEVTGTYTRPENALKAAFVLYSAQVAEVISVPNEVEES